MAAKMDSGHFFRAHSHAVILSEFQCVNTTIDSDVMSASMKDQYFGDVDKLQQRFVLQLRKLARQWKVQGSSFNADSQPILSELFDEHRSNVQDKVHWTSESLQPTARALTTWVACRILSCRSRDYDTSSTTTTICLGATTPCTPSYCSHSAQTDQGLAQSISFFRKWASPLLTVFGALIFELTKITFPDVPGQLSVQELVHQLWEALSSADPTE